jgi:hypothetical protein
VAGLFVWEKKRPQRGLKGRGRHSNALGGTASASINAPSCFPFRARWLEQRPNVGTPVTAGLASKLRLVGQSEHHRPSDRHSRRRSERTCSRRKRRAARGPDCRISPSVIFCWHCMRPILPRIGPRLSGPTGCQSEPRVSQRPITAPSWSEHLPNGLPIARMRPSDAYELKGAAFVIRGISFPGDER